MANPLNVEDIDSNRIVVENEPFTSIPLHTYSTNDVTALGGTITPKPPNVELDDIFISVKTTKANHGNRLDVISKTWFQLAAKQVRLSLCIWNGNWWSGCIMHCDRTVTTVFVNHTITILSFRDRSRRDVFACVARAHTHLHTSSSVAPATVNSKRNVCLPLHSVDELIWFYRNAIACESRAFMMGRQCIEINCSPVRTSVRLADTHQLAALWFQRSRNVVAAQNGAPREQRGEMKWIACPRFGRI